MCSGLYGGAAGLQTSVAASDPTEGLWARSEAAELLPGAILTLHPAPRRSPRDSNQSDRVCFSYHDDKAAPLRLKDHSDHVPRIPVRDTRHRALGRPASGPREPLVRFEPEAGC